MRKATSRADLWLCECGVGAELTETEKNISLFIEEEREREGGACSCLALILSCFQLNELHYFLFCLLFCFITIVGKVIFINFCFACLCYCCVRHIIFSNKALMLCICFYNYPMMWVCVLCIFRLVSKSNVSAWKRGSNNVSILTFAAIH